MSVPPLQMLLHYIEQSPRFKEILATPVGQNAFNAMKSGDFSKCKEIGMNLCESRGISQEEAMNQAQQMQQMAQNFPNSMFGFNKPF